MFEVGISEDNVPVCWMFNNQELSPSESYTMLSDKKTHRLMVQHVDHSNQGEYIMLVGHLQCSARLLVECECLTFSTISQNLREGTTLLGHLLTFKCLSCSAASHQTPEGRGSRRDQGGHVRMRGLPLQCPIRVAEG